MKQEKSPTEQPSELVKAALGLHIGNVITAYEKYTKEVLKCAKACQPISRNQRDFDTQMKSIKARLSARKALAVKAARTLIIEAYLKPLGEAEDLNMSAREAMEAIKMTCGRSVSKSKVTGLFTRTGDTRYSPFFTDSAYRATVLKHPLFVELGAEINTLNRSIPRTENHKKKQLREKLEQYI